MQWTVDHFEVRKKTTDAWNLNFASSQIHCICIFAFVHEHLTQEKSRTDGIWQLCQNVSIFNFLKLKEFHITCNGITVTEEALKLLLSLGAERNLCTFKNKLKIVAYFELLYDTLCISWCIPSRNLFFSTIFSSAPLVVKHESWSVPRYRHHWREHRQEKRYLQKRLSQFCQYKLIRGVHQFKRFFMFDCNTVFLYVSFTENSAIETLWFIWNNSNNSCL